MPGLELYLIVYLLSAPVPCGYRGRLLLKWERLVITAYSLLLQDLSAMFSERPSLHIVQQAMHINAGRRQSALSVAISHQSFADDIHIVRYASMGSGDGSLL